MEAANGKLSVFTGNFPFTITVDRLISPDKNASKQHFKLLLGQFLPRPLQYLLACKNNRVVIGIFLCELVYFRLHSLVREGELESIFTHSVSISSEMDAYSPMIAVYIIPNKEKKTVCQ